MTNTQKQLLLAYLGFYDHRDDQGRLVIDGKWGAKSQEAADKLLKEFGVATSQEQKEKADLWDEIEFFSREEFRCPCGKCNGFPVEPQEGLVRAVDAMRGAFGTPVIVVPPDGHSGGSGVRCQAYNDSLPGSVVNSRHVQGKAADFSAPGVTESTIEAYLTKIKSDGTIRYWYKIGPGSYHMDVE